jgi:hypothetical protein
MNDARELGDLYQLRREQREGRLRRFFAGTGEPFLVFQNAGLSIYNHCNTLEDLVAANVEYMGRALAMEYSDSLPYMEPWMGTGVFANAYGCEYVWRDNESPACHYRFHQLEELAGVQRPDWRGSEIMQRVLTCIDRLKEATEGRLPIAMTDTQSPFDTATLVLDAAELFMGCYAEPELVGSFMSGIADLVIEFSRVQAERIGPELLAEPGHLMGAAVGLKGIAIADDNLAVSSPEINRRMALPLDERIGQTFGGIAIHSCGNWARTMRLMKDYPSIRMVDCALPTNPDPTPNVPEEVRDALRGTGIVAKVRIGNDFEKSLPVLDRVLAPDMKLIVEFPLDVQRERENYELIHRHVSQAMGVAV